jgi:hypothetical protein
MTLFRNHCSTLLGKMAATAVILTFCASAANAALHWDATEIDLQLRDGSPTAAARFTFVNSGNSAVDIREVHPECGCTVALPAKTHIEPGEKGEIPVEFHVGRRSGTQRVSIAVKTSDGAEPTQLLLVVEIESLVNVTQHFLMWAAGEPREARSVRITLSAEQPVKLASVSSSDPGFTAKIVPVIGSTREFDVVVTPPATGSAICQVKLRTLLGPQEVERIYTILARTLL